MFGGPGRGRDGRRPVHYRTGAHHAGRRSDRDDFPIQTGRTNRGKLTFASVYPHYVDKVVKKGRSEEELLQVIRWLTGFTKAQIKKHIKKKSTFEAFFDDAELNPNASLITGVICGYRVEEIENPLTQKGRYMDKLVDELARGKKMESILRS